MSDTSGRTQSDVLTRGEIILFLLLLLAGVCIWGLIDRLMSVQMVGEQPMAEQMQSTADMPHFQAQLAMTASERKQTQEQLIGARLDVARHSATVGAIETVYPQLIGISATKAVTPAVESATLQAYQDARVKLLAATKLRDSLTTRLDEIDKEEKDITANFQKAQRDAGKNYEQAQWSFQMKRNGLTFALTVVVVLVVLVVSLGLLTLQGRRRGAHIHRSIVVGGAGLVLLVASAYQTFGIAGAAIGGLLAR